MSETFFQRCPSCQATNRIPRQKVGQQAKCGKCGTFFTAVEATNSSPVHVTDATFTQEVLQASIPVLVDFWAPWCGPCRMVAPVLEELAQEFAGQVKIAKLNTDENQRTASQYQIQGIPTLLFVKNGQVVDQVVGVTPKSHLANKLRQML